jgi:hypothetical protein
MHMMADIPHVKVIAIDFTKGFDTVRHATLVGKLATLRLADHVGNWLGDFSQRTYCTVYDGGERASNLELTASIVQG